MDCGSWARSIRHDRGESGKISRGISKIGQLVAMNFRSACGVCYYCTKGMAQFCERRFPISGAMAEYSVYRENTVFPCLPVCRWKKGVSWNRLRSRYARLDTAKINTGDTVIITGGGPIGLLVLQLAIKAGASKVLVSTRSPEKRALAKQLGADVVVDPIHEDLLGNIQSITDGRGSACALKPAEIPVWPGN